jgi:hypothetical protein
MTPQTTTATVTPLPTAPTTRSSDVREALARTRARLRAEERDLLDRLGAVRSDLAAVTAAADLLGAGADVREVAG